LYKDENSIRPYLDEAVTGNEGLDGLANSLDWSSIHLIKAGKKIKKILKKCPKTKETLSHLPMPKLAGNGPEVFLSVLKSGAEIKPHYGLSNIKLTVHLGLDIPENCALRSGTETQYWENGKVMIFDDSFEHEAWNHSDKDRYVLIMEVWHPDLTELEKQGIQRVQELQHQFAVDASKETYDSLLESVKAEIS
jgi:aspartyl/asparaginyl beta-hydroxylase (cupin superfamily)